MGAPVGGADQQAGRRLGHRLGERRDDRHDPTDVSRNGHGAALVVDHHGSTLTRPAVLARRGERAALSCVRSGRVGRSFMFRPVLRFHDRRFGPGDGWWYGCPFPIGDHEVGRGPAEPAAPSSRELNEGHFRALGRGGWAARSCSVRSGGFMISGSGPATAGGAAARSQLVIMRSGGYLRGWPPGRVGNLNEGHSRPIGLGGRAARSLSRSVPRFMITGLGPVTAGGAAARPQSLIMKSGGALRSRPPGRVGS